MIAPAIASGIVSGIVSGIAHDIAHGTIRKVLRSETALVGQHLLRLDTDARSRRFSHEVSDAFIADYARKSAEFGSLVFGYYFAGEIHAIAELKPTGGIWSATAEAAFSVERDVANQGIASALMGRIIRSARNRGVRHLMLCCLTENAKMRSIASKYGAELHIEDGAIVGDIVPQLLDYYSLVSEAYDDRLGYLHAMLDLQIRMKNAA